MARTNLREVLEAIGAKAPGITQERDAVALLDLHLGRVQACQHTDALDDLIKARDGARKALQATFKVRTDSMVARSHADPLEQALGPLERLIDRMQGETQGGTQVARERFEKRWSQDGWRVEKLQDYMGKSTGGWPSEEVESAVESFRVNAKALTDARANQDWPAANQAMDEVVKDLLAYDEANAPFNEKYKEDFLKLLPNAQKVIDKLDTAISGHLLGNPPTGEFAKAIDVYGVQRQQMDTAVEQNDYRVALNAAKNLDKLVPRFLGMGLQDLKTALAASVTRAEQMRDGMDGGAFPGVDSKPLKSALARASQGLKTASTYDSAEALASKEPLEAAMKAARTAAVKGLIQGGAKTPKAARAQALALLKHDKDAMKALADEPGGPEWLDGMVGDLGGKAKDGDSKAFVRAAISARFGPELGDKDLTTKYLPRLYKVLGMVPPSHTLANPLLATINRERTKVMPSGDYLSGVINLQVPRTGFVDSLVSLGARVLPQKLLGKVTHGSGISMFDLVALHEVGHAVDDKQQFMAGKVGNVRFGGWNKHGIEEVVAALGDGLGFFKDCADQGSKAFLKAYLQAVLQKKKPQDEASVTGEVKVGDKPDWKKLAKHAAVACAENIRLKSSDSGLWDRGDAAANKYAIGGSVYQESYGGKWVSYALSARATKVTDYQFRAEGEWYAEAYAAFFVKKLGESHPLHPVLTKDTQSTQAAQRAAR